MHNQVYIFMLGIFFLVALTHSAPLSNDNDDDLDLTQLQVAEARSILDDDLLINKLMNSLNRRDFFDSYQQLELSVRGFSSEQKNFQKEMLKAHNTHRARHCVPPLQLDDKLSRSAQKYAEKLAREDKWEHSGTPGVGENLWMSMSGGKIRSVDGRSVTDSWYNEIKQYSFAHAGFSMAAGHFTQVVWKNTKKIGAGFAFSKDHHKVYVVAQYTPPGNYRGQFPRNVLPATC